MSVVSQEGFFHNWRRSRFIDVFTKLRALELDDFEKVLLLDLDILIREGSAPLEHCLKNGSASEGLASLFNLKPPAAMKRGDPSPEHGEEVVYSRLWAHPTRRKSDGLPPHQQASGINAGVMLLKPDKAMFTQIDHEVHDWFHPEHYQTYMPEQEYLGRLFGTFDRWTHISCHFNFEVDKNERVAHDFSEVHESIRNGGIPGHAGAVVLHYSGTGVKPWDLLYGTAGDAATLQINAAHEVPRLLARWREEGPAVRLEGYKDQERLWLAMLEWLEQFVAVASRVADAGCDIIALMKAAVESDKSQPMETEPSWWAGYHGSQGYGGTWIASKEPKTNSEPWGQSRVRNDSQEQ
eukprot:TRINITY_DN41262_c0_g1_i1.p1 TRINITY_DN41262_c0_g1~~TRINITY_DN41262_c0_g1_i1.p1  ORF type:complete len:351 (-),score=78.15 TRINITY_DN41262_c0_g1_i1:193-1245(-)